MARLGTVMRSHESKIRQIDEELKNKRNQQDKLATVTMMSLDLIGTNIKKKAAKNIEIESGEGMGFTYNEDSDIYYAMTPDNKVIRAKPGAIRALADNPALLVDKDSALDFFYSKTDEENPVYTVHNPFVPTLEQYDTELPDDFKNQSIIFALDSIHGVMVSPNDAIQGFDMYRAMKGFTDSNYIEYFKALEGTYSGSYLHGDIHTAYIYNQSGQIVGVKDRFDPSLIEVKNHTSELAGAQENYREAEIKWTADREAMFDELRAGFAIPEKYPKLHVRNKFEYWNGSEIADPLFLHQYGDHDLVPTEVNKQGARVWLTQFSQSPLGIDSQQIMDDTDNLTGNTANVTKLQEFLVTKKLLKKTDVDGKWGPKTELAYMTAQTDLNRFEGQVSNYLGYAEHQYKVPVLNYKPDHAYSSHHLGSEEKWNASYQMLEDAYTAMVAERNWEAGGDFIEIAGFLDDNNNYEAIMVNPWEYNLFLEYGDTIDGRNQVLEYLAKKSKEHAKKNKLAFPIRDDLGRIRLQAEWIAGAGAVMGIIGGTISAIQWLSGAWDQASANRQKKKELTATMNILKPERFKVARRGFDNINKLKDNFKTFIKQNVGEFSLQDQALVDSLELLHKKGKGLKINYKNIKGDALEALTAKYGNKMKEFKMGFENESEQLRTKLHDDIDDLGIEIRSLQSQWDYADDHDDFLENLF